MGYATFLSTFLFLFFSSLLISLLEPSSAFVPNVYKNLSEARRIGFRHWCNIDLETSHYSWPPNQATCLWTNISMTLPRGTLAIQITTADSSGRHETPLTYIEQVSISGQQFNFSLEYWYMSCKVYVGFLTFDRTMQQEQKCEATIETPKSEDPIC